MAEIGRNDHIVFAFCVTYLKIILNENTDIFRKKSGTSRIVVFYFTKVLHIKFQKGQNDFHGFSSVYTIQLICRYESKLYLHYHSSAGPAQ